MKNLPILYLLVVLACVCISRISYGGIFGTFDIIIIIIIITWKWMDLQCFCHFYFYFVVVVMVVI